MKACNGKKGSKKLRFLFSHFPLLHKKAGVICTDVSFDFLALSWTIRLQVSWWLWLFCWGLRGTQSL